MLEKQLQHCKKKKKYKKTNKQSQTIHQQVTLSDKSYIWRIQLFFDHQPAVSTISVTNLHDIISQVFSNHSTLNIVYLRKQCKIKNIEASNLLLLRETNKQKYGVSKSTKIMQGWLFFTVFWFPIYSEKALLDNPTLIYQTFCHTASLR